MTTISKKIDPANQASETVGPDDRGKRSTEPASYPDERDRRTPRQDGGRDITLSHQEAQAGSPDDSAVCGEEDIGVGLEFLVTDDQDHSENENSNQNHNKDSNQKPGRR